MDRILRLLQSGKFARVAVTPCLLYESGLGAHGRVRLGLVLRRPHSRELLMTPVSAGAPAIPGHNGCTYSLSYCTHTIGHGRPLLLSIAVAVGTPSVPLAILLPKAGLFGSGKLAMAVSASLLVVDAGCLFVLKAKSAVDHCIPLLNASHAIAKR